MLRGEPIGEARRRSGRHRLVGALQGSVQPADPVAAEAVIARVGDGPEFARRPELIDRCLGQFVSCVVAFHIAYHELGARALGGGHDLLRLGNAHRHRLFHKDVLPRQQQVAGDVTLHGKPSRHGDGVDLGIGRQLLVAAVEPLDPLPHLHAAPQLGPEFGQRD